MRIEKVRVDGSTLLYLGQRSPETRFLVLGVHNTEPWRHRVRRLEATFYLHRGTAMVWHLHTMRVPKKSRRGPFLVVDYLPGIVIEVDIGWKSARKG